MSTPRPITWTPDLIARFWNRYESTKGMDLWHFSRQRGCALLGYAAKKITIREPVLDLGCGSGHLIGLLLERGHKSFGADVSSKGLEIVAGRFSSNPGFLGARLMETPQKVPFEDASIGSVFLLETIEHLLPETRDSLFAEIFRVLGNNGYVVITTPWCEDLAAGNVVCEGCGCVFHKTQHLRAFDETTVAALCEGAGLTVISSQPVLLLPDFNVWLRAQITPARSSIVCPECDTSCKSPNQSIATRWKSIAHELKHLVCIAQKKYF